MGGGFTGCEGDDVIQNLKDVFGHPGKTEYQKAQGKKQLFYDIWQGTGSYQDLHDAYMAVGVKDSPNWKGYLGTLGPDNIKRIALARFEGLDRSKPMHTKTHDPTKGGDHKVHWKHETDLSITIDSPFTPS
jgi:hypothetical protein